jgi:deoxycytidine triphosphate deaminase
MILSKNTILMEKEKGNIIYYSPQGYKIENFCQNQSVDVHIWDEIYFPETKTWVTLPEDGTEIEIPKHSFFLASTEEFIGTSAGSNIQPEWHLRSTLARLGFGHPKAGWGDVGFFNRWAMEFYSYLPLKLKRGARVGQLVFVYNAEQLEQMDYVKETGNYQSTNDLELLSKEWKKEDILPKQGNY